MKWLNADRLQGNMFADSEISSLCEMNCSQGWNFTGLQVTTFFTVFILICVIVSRQIWVLRKHVS